VIGAGLGLLAVENLDQGLTLSRIGPFVDDGLQGAFALENGTGPGIEHGPAQTVQGDIAEVASVDPGHLEALATAVSR
jgi:hypothetical protein